MQVQQLISFLSSLKEPIRLSGGAKVANDLADVCTNLESFQEMSIEQFADFLSIAAHYRQTGEIPTTPTAKKQAAPISDSKILDEQKVGQFAQQLTELYEHVIEESISYGDIEQALKAADNSLNKDELFALAQELNIEKSLKSKKDAIKAIKDRFFDRKQNFQRTAF